MTNIIKPDLKGVEEIAEFLGLETTRQVYKLLENRRLGKTNIPIWREPGIGVVSCRSLLQEYIKQQAIGLPPMPPPQGQGEPTYGQNP